MTASPRLRFGIAAAGLSCLFAGYVVAQQQTVREQPGLQNPAIGQTDQLKTPRREYTANFRGNQATTAAQSQEVQRYIVGCLLSKNQAEVELGKFAQQQSQTPEVKEFAQRMAQDHSKLIQKLQQVAGTQTDAQPGAPTSERTPAAATRDAAGQNAVQLNAADRTANNNSAVDQLLAMERQIVERCTQAAREELQQKQGAAFDKAYIGQQIGGHIHMLAALEVIQQQGPQELQQLAQQAQPEVKKHLDQARQIMKQLEGAGAVGSRAARQPTQPQR